MPNGGVLCTYLLILRPGVLRSTLSHIWCKLNLPMILLSVMLLTLMYMDSFNSSGYVMVLSPYYLEVILCSTVASGVSVIMYRWRILQMLLESFSKGPGGLSYIFLITCKLPTLEPVNGSTFNSQVQSTPPSGILSPPT